MASLSATYLELLSPELHLVRVQLYCSRKMYNFARYSVYMFKVRLTILQLSAQCSFTIKMILKLSKLVVICCSYSLMWTLVYHTVHLIQTHIAIKPDFQQ